MPLPRHIGDASFARSVESPDAGLVLVDFWAPGCAPCQAVVPVLDALGVAYHGRVRIVKVNIDESTAAAARYDIEFIPTIALFDNGTMVARHVGPAPRATLEALLNDAIARRATVAHGATPSRHVNRRRLRSRVDVLAVFVFDPVISCATGMPHISLRRVRVLIRRLTRAWRTRRAGD
ncbi:MAG: thioredoxin domain-containing protein [Gemmatimonadaceae bacterium]